MSFFYECGKISKVFPFVLSFMFCEFFCVYVFVCFLLNCSYYLQRDRNREKCNLVLLLFPNHWLLASIDVLYVCVSYVCVGCVSVCVCVLLMQKAKNC